MHYSKKVNINIGTSIMTAFTRMPVKTEQLLREFIDNSTTSYYDNEATLNKVVEQQKCIVQIDWDQDSIVIEDNAFGMDEEAFARALRPNAKAEYYSVDSRGKYGLGLKYAALNLGSKYSIESTAFGNSQLFYATIDLEELKQDIETVDCIVTDCLESKHYTKITITNLIRDLRVRKKGINEEEKLREAISEIYFYDITHGKLDVWLNGKKIVCNTPELLQRKDGGEYFSTFDDSFIFGGKEYCYRGTIGILNKASLSKAGFRIAQKDRVIQLEYRPEELFGKSNDFRYQRVIGEISLEGDSWIVTFTKDSVKWEAGLEDAFIQSLKDNKEIMSIFKYAKEYRKGKENITPETINKWKSDLEKTFSNNNSKKQTDKTKLNTSITSYTPTTQVDQYKNPIKDQSSVYDGTIIPINYGGTEYEFKIIPVDNNSDAPWIRTQIMEGYENRYKIDLNVRCPVFDEYTDQKSKKLITKIAICVALAQISSRKAGLSLAESQKLIDEINTILSMEKKD